MKWGKWALLHASKRLARKDWEAQQAEVSKLALLAAPPVYTNQTAHPVVCQVQYFEGREVRQVSDLHVLDVAAGQPGHVHALRQLVVAGLQQHEACAFG